MGVWVNTTGGGVGVIVLVPVGGKINVMAGSGIRVVVGVSDGVGEGVCDGEGVLLVAVGEAVNKSDTAA